MPAHRVARLDEIPQAAEPEPGSYVWKPVRHHLGVTAFGVNAWIGREPGDWVIEEHVEEIEGGSPHEELYYVASGRATFLVDGDEIDAPTGTFVFVPDPMVKRGARAVETDTAVIAVGAAPGIAYEVSPWERKHWDE
ncbi:MAG: hypothetical protein U0R69_14245 [Gaiellales bacterium]